MKTMKTMKLAQKANISDLYSAYGYSFESDRLSLRHLEIQDCISVQWTENGETGRYEVQPDCETLLLVAPYEKEMNDIVAVYLHDLKSFSAKGVAHDWEIFLKNWKFLRDNGNEESMKDDGNEYKMMLGQLAGYMYDVALSYNASMLPMEEYLFSFASLPKKEHDYLNQALQEYASVIHFSSAPLLIAVNDLVSVLPGIEMWSKELSANNRMADSFDDFVNSFRGLWN